MLFLPLYQDFKNKKDQSLCVVNLFLIVAWLGNGSKNCIGIDAITLCVIQTLLNYRSLEIRLLYITGYALEEESEYISEKMAVIQWLQWQSINFSIEQIGLCSTVLCVKHFPLLLWHMATENVIGK